MKTKQPTALLLQAALDTAAVEGWHSLTHASIAAAADCSPSLIKVRLGMIEGIRQAVMRNAVKQRVLRVVAEGLLAGNRAARRADKGLREACAELVLRA